MAFGKFSSGLVAQFRREARVTQKIMEDVIALSLQHGFSFWLAAATFHRGQALAAEGRHEEGIALMQEGLAAFRKIGAGIGSPHLALMAEAYGRAGRDGSTMV
jgi:hypothetical protein